MAEISPGPHGEHAVEAGAPANSPATQAAHSEPSEYRPGSQLWHCEVSPPNVMWPGEHGPHALRPTVSATKPCAQAPQAVTPSPPDVTAADALPTLNRPASQSEQLAASSAAENAPCVQTLHSEAPSGLANPAGQTEQGPPEPSSRK